jgi:NAD-dependent SIR2 family protein deacetylase
MVLEARKSTTCTPAFHRYLNHEFEGKRLQGIITTNVDGLEFKEAEQALLQGRSTDGMLTQGSEKVVQLHGTAYNGHCSPGNHEIALTEDIVAQLCAGIEVPCETCKANPPTHPRKAKSPHIMRPSITLYHDTLHSQASEAVLNGLNRCFGTRKHALKPDLILIVGSSLRNRELLRMLVTQREGCRGVEVFVVNPHWEPAFNQLGEDVQWIQEDAERWAAEMLRWSS